MMSMSTLETVAEAGGRGLSVHVMCLLIMAAYQWRDARKRFITGPDVTESGLDLYFQITWRCCSNLGMIRCSVFTYQDSRLSFTSDAI